MPLTPGNLQGAYIVRGYAYRRIEDAHFARNVEIRFPCSERNVRVVICNIVDEFICEDIGEALLRDAAAVDHQLDPGDERCLVGGEEQHAMRNFDRLTEAAEWSDRNLVGMLIGVGRIQHWRHIAGPPLGATAPARGRRAASSVWPRSFSKALAS